MKCINVLIIVGIDFSGGVGIQVDLKIFFVLGVYGCLVIIVLVVQNICGVQLVYCIELDFVVVQFDLVFSDVCIDIIKIGMLVEIDIVEVVVEWLVCYWVVNVVLDIVMLVKSGDLLLLVLVVEILC